MRYNRFSWILAVLVCAVALAGCKGSEEKEETKPVAGWEKIETAPEAAASEQPDAQAAEALETTETTGTSEAPEVPETAGAEASEATPEKAETADSSETPEDYYASLTSLPASDVEAFARKVKEAYLSADWETISGMIQYPVTMYPNVSVANEEEFLAYMQDKAVEELTYENMKQESCSRMDYNGEGVSMSFGTVWIRDTGFNGIEQVSDPSLKIFAITGFDTVE